MEERKEAQWEKEESTKINISLKEISRLETNDKNNKKDYYKEKVYIDDKDINM